MPRLTVSVTKNSEAKALGQIAPRHLQAIRDSLNRQATLADREATKTVAAELNLPERVVRNRLDRFGRVKSRRTKIQRATMNNLNVAVEVYLRGIPVTQIAGKELRRPGGGVKATGSRFYVGAFKARQQVFKRIGRERSPLMVPKVGVRERLRKEFDKRLTGPEGLALFRRLYLESCRRQLARFGVRT
jgi:hypothetical protein